MTEQGEAKLVRIAALIEIAGLATAAASVLAFGRITMLVFFALGIPAILAGMFLYVYVVLRNLIAKGSL